MPYAGGGAVLRVLGRYATYEDAIRARDKDVIDQLAARDGWYALIEHAIVGPGLRGPRTGHRLATAVGVDPAAGIIPCADDLDDARHWMAGLRDT